MKLPVDEIVPDIVAELRRERALVLEAPPGAGKTTRVPPALRDVVEGEIVVLQPRRLAARLAAKFVAEELGEPVGRTIGYQVRFDEVASRETRVRYVTEGILARRMLSDPMLRGVGAVILDEFHERHLHGDLALALLRRLQQGSRPDLRLCVMSATLDAAPVASWLGAKALRAEGRRFDVAVEYAGGDDRPLEKQVAAAVRRLAQDGLDGDVLVFLPGAAEIARAREACADAAARFDLAIVPLHGELPPEEQDLAVRPSARRRIVLSTNVAETSVTLPSVVAVVDSGLARVASHSPWSGLPVLKVARISQASATQRAGRAGRVRAGRCVRLYARHDFDARPSFDVPEIARLDLAELALTLHGAGVASPDEVDWFEEPPDGAIAAAETLLARLGAVANGGLTEVGRRLLRFPLHPRLGRVLVEAEGRGAYEAACAAVAGLGERNEFLAERARRQLVRLGKTSDPRDMSAPTHSGRGRVSSAASQPASDPRDMSAPTHSGRGRVSLGASARALSPDEIDAAVRISLLAGFPDRVGKRRGLDSPEVVLCGGGTADLLPDSGAERSPLVVALEIDERVTGTSRRVRIRAAADIETDWLIDVAPDTLREERAVEWNAPAERVERVERLRYENLVLDESRKPPAAGDDEAARLLAEKAVAAGVERFVDKEALSRWIERARVAGLEPPSPTDVLAAAARGLGSYSFADLRRVSILDSLRGLLTQSQQRAMTERAPDRITLPGGRSVKVEYAEGKPPWIESRLQDFFGMPRGPVAGGQPLVLHLLAPSGRPVQITTDLAGFWDRHYPAIRKELMRKYPKHSWPEDPRSASPPAPKRR